MTVSKSSGSRPQDATNPHYGPKLGPIPRSSVPAFNDVGEAIEADRRYFAQHPEADEYIREFVPGEFGAEALPEIQRFRQAFGMPQWLP